ncbi:MAG: N-acetylmuramoyl-L-alanine amidase [Gammaproteobacteria bacterium]|nr:N-acetylmuramoyl-L-alanine amidase [Gammaproteobacteria bacterium]
MKRFSYNVILILFLAVSSAWASAGQVTGVRLWDSPDGTRLVLDVNSSTDYSVFTLNNPQRVVIDLRNTSLKAPLPAVAQSRSVVKEVRAAARNGGKDLRVVLGVESLDGVKNFALIPQGQYGHRIVVDMGGKQAEEKPDAADPIAAVVASAAAKEKPKSGSFNVDAAPAPVAPPKSSGKTRDIVVAIDAGHGGEDPGAMGKYGTREKDVVLAIAKRLHDHLEGEPGIRPVLIRTGDYYLSLRQRIRNARKHNADLFISIHADAFNNRDVKGSSVYILSQRGASNETARWLAEKENSADLIGGVSLDDKDNMLAQVLLDLSMNGTIDVSEKIAEHVLKEMTKVGDVHKSNVQSAGFVVLKSPDIPSMLIETAFISNPSEERRLKDGQYQDRLAKSIVRGVKRYFENHPPPGSVFAQRGMRAQVSLPEDVTPGSVQISIESAPQNASIDEDHRRAEDRTRDPVL